MAAASPKRARDGDGDGSGAAPAKRRREETPEEAWAAFFLGGGGGRVAAEVAPLPRDEFDGLAARAKAVDEAAARQAYREYRRHKSDLCGEVLSLIEARASAATAAAAGTASDDDGGDEDDDDDAANHDSDETRRLRAEIAALEADEARLRRRMERFLTETNTAAQAQSDVAPEALPLRELRELAAALKKAAQG